MKGRKRKPTREAEESVGIELLTKTIRNRNYARGGWGLKMVPQNRYINNENDGESTNYILPF